MILVYYAVILYVIVEFGLFIFKAYQKAKNLPPGPQWYYPIIGNSKLVRKLAIQYGGQYEAFAELTRRFKSPIISLKLGSDFVVYVSSYQLIKEIHTRSEFDGRPDNYFLRLRTMGSRLGITCTDGEHWHEQRSFVVRQLRNVGFGRSKMEKSIQNELTEILQILDEKKEIYGGENNVIATSVINILWTLTCGAKFDRNDMRLKRLFNLLNRRAKVFDMSGGTLSQMPWMRFIAPESSGFNLINSLNREFYELFMGVIEDHLNDFSVDKASDDLIYAFINEMRQQQDQNTNTTFTVKQLVMVILDIFIAGATTTSTTIDLAFMSLLLHPEVQRKCRKEIEKAQNINYADRHLLPFTVATILESQRLFSITPITGPRRTLNDCKLHGYQIPKNTTILIGSKSILEGEELWKDPENFRPERFLDDDMKINQTLQERVLSFGSGKRRCLGDQLAKECIFTFTVGILKKFTLEKCENEEPTLKLLPGIIYTPKKFKILFKKS